MGLSSLKSERFCDLDIYDIIIIMLMISLDHNSADILFTSFVRECEIYRVSVNCSGVMYVEVSSEVSGEDERLA